MRHTHLLLGLLPLTAAPQDPVTNGDPEEFTACPDYVSQIDRATGWFRPTEGTSDYFNGCLYPVRHSDPTDLPMRIGVGWRSASTPLHDDLHGGRLHDDRSSEPLS